jgi:hypothetical protein
MVKNMLAVTLFSSGILFLSASNAAAADRVQAGEWENKMTMGAAKPTLTKHCITAAEAKAMNGDVAVLRKYLEQSTAANTRGRCTVKSVELKANVTTVTIACGKTEVTSTTTYHGDHYESSSSNGTTLVGKRLGACRK